MTPEEQADHAIRNAEAAKAKIFPSKGRQASQQLNDNEFRFIAQMDQDYLVVGNHVDETTQQ